MLVVLQHVPYEGPGLIGEMLEGRGLPCKIMDVFEEGVPLSAAGLTGLVSMGGPMSVNDGTAEIEKEKELISEAVDRGIPVLGVCLGAQIIANVLGASVYPGSHPEAGWGEIELTESGLDDPLLGGFEQKLAVLHWHNETFDLPEGSVHLARSRRFENQAFRVGSTTYGLQFHLEADEEMVHDWVSKDLEGEDGLISEPDEILKGIRVNIDKVRFAGSLFIGRFLDLVAGRGSG